MRGKKKNVEEAWMQPRGRGINSGGGRAEVGCSGTESAVAWLAVAGKSGLRAVNKNVAVFGGDVCWGCKHCSRGLPLDIVG